MKNKLVLKFEVQECRHSVGVGQANQVFRRIGSFWNLPHKVKIKNVNLVNQKNLKHTHRHAYIIELTKTFTNT